METFVVRVWVSADLEQAEADSGLHGFVEHSGFDRAQPFRTSEELMVLIRTAAASDVGRSRVASPDEVDEALERAPE